MLCGENYIDAVTMRNELGKTCIELGNYPKALDCFYKSLDVSIELFGENSIEVATIYIAMGILYSELEDFYKALEFCEKAKRNCQLLWIEV